jgi:hypothetical protein
MENFVNKLKSLVFLWGLAVSMLGAIGTAYVHCEECIQQYPALISMLFAIVLEIVLVITLVTIFRPIIQGMQESIADNREAIKTSSKLSEARHRQNREAHTISEIDRIHQRYIHSDSITAYDAEYAAKLYDTMKDLGLNSFNERKIKAVISKDIQN